MSTSKLTLETVIDAMTALGQRIKRLETRADNCDAEHDRTKRKIDKLDQDFGSALADLAGLDDE